MEKFEKANSELSVNTRLGQKKEVTSKRTGLRQALNPLLRVKSIMVVLLVILCSNALAQNQKSEKYKYKWCVNNVDGMQYPIAYGEKDSIVVTLTYKGYSHDSIVFNHPVIYGTNITRFKIEKIDESWEDDKTWSGHKIFIVVADKENYRAIGIYMADKKLSTIIN